MNSQEPLNPEDILRVTHCGRSLARGKVGPVPDLRVFRTEWLHEPKANTPGGWSQTVHASAPGVGSFRFTWGPAGGQLRAFAHLWDVEVKARAHRGVAGPR